MTKISPNLALEGIISINKSYTKLSLSISINGENKSINWIKHFLNIIWLY